MQDISSWMTCEYFAFSKNLGNKTACRWILFSVDDIRPLLGRRPQCLKGITMRRRLSLITLTGWLVLPFLMGGCSEQVREDRTITFSDNGKAAGFQHGAEGVFVTNSQTGALEKVFQPDEYTLATSTPLWAPDNKRMLFTTAVERQTDPDAPPPGPVAAIPWDIAPEGRAFLKQPIRYTCWLRTETADVDTSKPVALFEADCLHTGYVAANLAVRWHPDGQKVLYVKQVDEHHHGVYEFDIDSRASRRVFPHAASAVIFDYSPDGKYLVCLAAANEEPPSRHGMWISETDGANWWRVPQTAIGEDQDGLVSIEKLRAARPAWSRQAAQFAFITSSTPAENQTEYVLYLGNAESREVRPLLTDSDQLAQLHWAPDGKRMGIVTGEQSPSLQFVALDGTRSMPINVRPVRKFAGWNAAGDQLAYVAPEAFSRTLDDSYWAMVFFPQPLARDVIYVAPGNGSATGDAVFSGMRVTFPHWSPTEEKLSVWFTYTPTYRSLLSEFLRWGLQQGDPAAIFDIETGDIEWMTVNAAEKVQVGHYHLLQKDYDAALKWYEQAAAELPPEIPPESESMFRPFVGLQNFAFFHYYCLDKLGRTEEAAAKLADFERTFFPPPAEISATATPEEQQVVADQNQWLDAQTPMPRLLRNLYIAEVFLSLEAAAEAETFFRAALETAPHENAQLADAIVLSQILLVRQKTAEYADFATNTLAPLVKQTFHFEQYGPAAEDRALMLLPEHLAVTSLVPMFSTEFVAGLTTEQVGTLVPRWETLREQSDHDTAKLGCDLFLKAAYQRLDRPADQRRVEQDLAKNPQREKLLPEGGIDELVREFREVIARQTP